MESNIKIKEFIAHLRRHAIPELIDDRCLAALNNIETQYGEKSPYVVLLEVRLGEESRYVDYSILLDEENETLPSRMWYEFDYEQFATGKKIEPCLFFTMIEPTAEDYREIFDKTLPTFLGEERAQKLRKQLEKIVRTLPKGSYIRQIGTMSSRGELETARVIVRIVDRENICKFLAEMNWKGDLDALWKIIKTWNGQNYFSLDFDLGEDWISEKIGLEISTDGYHHPVIVDMYITRLEEMGLCLKSKGDGLRNWIRILPDADPFIQTRIQYFKLNFLDGKIIEAKAYIEQSPYILHQYFKNFDRPHYVEFILKDEENILPIGTAMKYLYDCEYNRVRRIHFLGDVAGYEHLDRLLSECKEEKIFVSIEITGKVTCKRLKEMINEGANEFIVAIENESALKILQELDFADVRAKWFMDGENFRELKQKVELAESLGVKELIITGMKPHDVKKSAPSREALEQTANFIKDYEKTSAQIILSVEPCFSVLRAFICGEDVRRNGNRGMNRGCTAGRDHFCITASGKFSPCSLLSAEDGGRIADYWEKSPALEKLRAMEENRPSQCKGCRYERRCLPCPSFFDCPIPK